MNKIVSDELVDIAINLTHESFSHDRNEVVERAKQAGVKTLVITGTSLAESIHALELAAGYDYCYCTAGIHPHDAKDVKNSHYAELSSLISQKKVVAVGETGLDFNRNFSPRDAQEQVFEQQIELAIESGKPLFCHERDASDRFAEMIKPYRDDISRLVVHCFTADKKALYNYLDMDCHIGMTGWICDERRGSHLHPLLKDIPANRLMVETDGPYLLPRTLSPKPKTRRNEPVFLTEVVKTIAEITGKTYTVVAAETTATARAFFSLDQDE